MGWSLATSWNGRNSSTSWHLSLPASLSQVQHVLGEQRACHFELASGSTCAPSCCSEANFKSSDLMNKLERISLIYLCLKQWSQNKSRGG